MDVRLEKGDCLEIMESIPAGSVDLILCDLPYGSTQNPWDTIIPLDELWKHYDRIAKPNSAIVLFAQTPFDKVLGSSNLKDLKYEWIWKKHRPTGFLNAKKAPLKEHENILVFYKAPPTYNPQGLVPCYKVNRRSASSFKNYGKAGVENIATETNYPRDVLDFASPGKAEGNYHPTQKPVALLEYLIKTYSNEGDVVLDNCMGSGSTGVACVNTKRNFIGIEREESYYSIAEERIRKVKGA